MIYKESFFVAGVNYRKSNLKKPKNGLNTLMIMTNIKMTAILIRKDMNITHKWFILRENLTTNLIKMLLKF